MKKILVLGGGTAGWLTALLTKEFYPQFDVTLVESDAIGILGAGEGTVPHIIAVLDFLKIPVSALIKECSATVKSGIKFTNWHGDGTSYFHSFIGDDELEMWNLDNIFRFNVLPTMLVGKNIPLDAAGFVPKLAAAAKVPFIVRNILESDYVKYPDPMHALHHLGSFALHFDARLLANFFAKIAQQQRDIKRVEGKLHQVLTDSEGNISGLALEDGNQVPCDFIFDCSGFARLLIGKHFGAQWVDYSSYLPLDTALPFFIPHDGKNLPPYTEAIAMKYGWIWKIPVQERYGCGYVFASSFINEEQALAEVEEYLGFRVDSPKTFRFKAGAFHNTLVKNCFAVGLAQNFVEPLEATSIWVFTKNLINFLKSDAISNLTPEVAEMINMNCRSVNDPIPEFLQLHYLTRRCDTAFWADFRKRLVVMPSLQQKLSLWEQTPLFDRETLQLEMFQAPSWLMVGAGVGVFNQRAFQRVSNNFNFEANIQYGYDALLARQQQAVRACMDHSDFIALLKNN